MSSKKFFYHHSVQFASADVLKEKPFMIFCLKAIKKYHITIKDASFMNIYGRAISDLPIKLGNDIDVVMKFMMKCVKLNGYSIYRASEKLSFITQKNYLALDNFRNDKEVQCISRRFHN
eukprot:gene3169-5485_t